MPRNFQKEIEADLDWREAEIAYLRILISGEKTKSIRQRVLLRSAWAILYAHYEGFCKFCFNIYLDAISDASSNTGLLTNNLIALALNDELSEVKLTLSHLQIVDFVDKRLRRLLREKPKFENALPEANLWPSVLKKMGEKLGIQSNEIINYERKISTLVARRNDIAHGQGVFISDLGYYSEYEHAALCVMYDLALSVTTAIADQAYMRSSLRPSVPTSPPSPSTPQPPAPSPPSPHNPSALT